MPIFCTRWPAQLIESKFVVSNILPQSPTPYAEYEAQDLKHRNIHYDQLTDSEYVESFIRPGYQRYVEDLKKNTCGVTLDAVVRIIRMSPNCVDIKEDTKDGRPCSRVYLIAKSLIRSELQLAKATPINYEEYTIDFATEIDYEVAIGERKAGMFYTISGGSEGLVIAQGVGKSILALDFLVGRRGGSPKAFQLRRL